MCTLSTYFTRCSHLTSRELRKNISKHCKATVRDPVIDRLVETNFLEVLEIYLFAGKIQVVIKSQFSKIFPPVLTVRLCWSFQQCPSVAEAQAEKQNFLLYSWDYQCLGEKQDNRFLLESHCFRSPGKNCILLVQCIFAQMFLTRKNSACFQTVCGVTKELSEK